MRATPSFSPARLRLLVVTAAAALLLAACNPGPGGGPNTAAVVAGEDIAVSEVERRFESVRENPQIAPQLEADDEDGTFASQVQAQILTQLIQSRLLRSGAEELGVEVGEDEIAAKRDEVVEQVGGEEAFADLVEQNNLTDEDVDEQLRDLAYQDAVQERLTEDVDVSDEEVVSFYEENEETRFGESASARHVLVETEDEAQAVLDRLEEGEEFGAVAEDVSTDTGSAEQGGDLGEFTRERMVPEFADAVFDSDPGEVVGPVQTEFGFHVIEVTDRQEARELGEVEEEIRDELRQQRQEEAVQSWLQDQNREAEVEVNPRFGEWDPDVGQVVVADGLGDEPATEQPGTAPGAEPGAEGPGPDAGGEGETGGDAGS